MMGLRSLLPTAVFAGLLVVAGCGDEPAPTPAANQPVAAGGLDIRPAAAPAPAPRTVTGVPVQEQSPADPSAPPPNAAAAALPPPPVAIDGFEAQAGWQLADFGNPGALQKRPAAYTAPTRRDQTVLHLAYLPGEKNKACLKLDTRLSLQPDGAIRLVVYNHAASDLAVAVALSTGEAHDWFESQPQTAAPGWSTLTWLPAGANWKSAAAQWQHTSAVKNMDDVRALHILAFNEHRSGSLTIAGVELATKRPAPPAPPPTAVVDWDTLVAGLPVNPLGKQRGLHAGTWVNDMTGDPARILVAPNALSTTTDRMLVLDWAAVTPPAKRKAGFVAAKQAFAPMLTLNKDGFLQFDVYNDSNGEAAISVGIISGDVATYHESKPVTLKSKLWTTVKLPLNAAEYKSAASQWEPTGVIAEADKLTGLVMKAFTTDGAGRLIVTALTAPVIVPPPAAQPSPQPMPPVEAVPPDADAPAPVAPPAEAPAEVPAADDPAPAPAAETPAATPPAPAADDPAAAPATDPAPDAP